jgi:protein KRI1
MLKRRADTLDNIQSSSITKKAKQDQTKEDPTQQSANTLIDSDSEAGSDNESEAGGVPLEVAGFTINEEYAKRFEHNKKREELHRCKFAMPNRTLIKFY